MKTKDDVLTAEEKLKIKIEGWDVMYKPRCFFFLHPWSNWVSTREIKTTDGTGNLHLIQHIQERVCKGCGKHQMRTSKLSIL